MSRKNVITSLKTPDGMFNTLKVDVVTNTDKGVAIVNESGGLMCWIEVQDPKLRRKVSQLISEQVCKAQTGVSVVPIDWDELGLIIED